MQKSVTFILASDLEEGLQNSERIDIIDMESNDKYQVCQSPGTISAAPDTDGTIEDGPSMLHELMKFTMKGFTLGLFGLVVYLFYILLRYVKGGSSPTTIYFLQIISVLIANLTFTHLLLGREEPREFAMDQVARWAETVLGTATLEICTAWIERLNTEVA